MTDVTQVTLDGLTNVSLYALVAVGVTLVFGLTGIVNFAQGQLVMLGAFVTWGALDIGVPFYLALVGGLATIGIAGAVLYVGLFQHTLRRPISGFIVSLGLLPIIDVIVVKSWGTEPHNAFPPLRDVWQVGGVTIVEQRLFVVGVTIAVLAALFAFIRLTHTGRALRACAEDREMTMLFGVDVRRLYLIAFIIGCAVAGLAGALILSLFPITPSIGNDYVFKGFAVALIGGLGSVSGAVIAATILGLSEAFLTRHVSGSWTEAYVLILMIVILLVRPLGIVRGSTGSSVH
jgi:branched-chain amino acid transport system permease protein